MSYRQFCKSPKQHAICDAIEAGGNPSRWASENGRSCSSARKSWRAVLLRAARAGYAPDQGFNPSTCPPGFVLDKSTVHAKDGVTVQRWDRVIADKQAAQEAILDAIAEACDGLKKAPTLAEPKSTKSGLLNVYTIADLHIGLLAWHRESGEDYTTPISRQVLWDAFSDMLSLTTDAETCVIVNLGDFLHYCGLIAETPAHHHYLDSDCRYHKLAEVALDLQIWMVSQALRKHKTVHLLNVEGNHDEAAVPWLKIAMSRIFADNPRVVVDESPMPYHAMLHGKTMLAWHHGHKRKDKDLGALFAADPSFRAMWGQAARTYIHTGHLHSQSVLELPGAVVERHPTLAARSSYEARGGWQSQRQAKAITYDANGNEIMRVTVTPEAK